MKLTSTNKMSRSLFKILPVLLAIGVYTLDAQVLVEFTQRTAAATPAKKIYSIRGDFTMIGNTNLSLDVYGDNTNNSNNVSRFVDVDADPNTFNSSSATLQFSAENGAEPTCSKIIYAGLYWTGRCSNGASSPETFTVSHGGVSKQFNKRNISLKGPGQANYTQFTASPGNIYYPSTSDGFMYSAYIEVTDYVKANGLGEYFVADMALTEGNGGSTGYYGGWGMIVIYENSKMNWRDVTVFDGHAYVRGNSTINYELPVSGFNTAQNGQVNLKLGLMAGEGDVGITGDYFRIRNHQDNAWVTLNHSGNTTTNFFNSSVVTGGNPRNPSLQNNTGIDIAMFNIPNAANSVITNNQTATKFQYGSTQDTYVIFCIAMSVDAYVPDVEFIVSTETINGIPVGAAPLTVLPGEDIEYKLQIKNQGTEEIDSTVFYIPIPYTTTYNNGSILTAISFTPSPIPDSAYYDPNYGETGAIVWNIGTIPMTPGHPDSVLAELTFHLKVIEDCNILKNQYCPPDVTLAGGVISGRGAISGISFSDKPFIQGYEQTGLCTGEPISEPIKISIDATDFIANNCQNTPDERRFVFCNYELPTIPADTILNQFPNGLRFYNTNKITASSIEYNEENPFPATRGEVTYFAIPDSLSLCYYPFTIVVLDVTSTPAVADVSYCLNATALPLGAVASNPAYTVYYYPSLTSTSGQTTVTPSTAIAGTTTYYVAEGVANECISPNRDSIMVSVYDISAHIDNASLQHVLCKGDSTGAATVIVAGGTGNYNYSWSTSPVKTTSTASVLKAGNYTVTVTDNTGCMVPVTTTVSITEPADALSAIIDSKTDVFCKYQNTGSATVTASGGSGGYTYLWNDELSQTTAVANNLSARKYRATVYDNNGCLVPATASVTITEPANALEVSVITQTNVACKGGSTGSAIAQATGGSGNYAYLWSDVSGQTTALATGLAAGTYTIAVSDNNGCIFPVTSTAEITEPQTALSVDISAVTHVFCKNESTGFATATAKGGSGSYSYLWNDALNQPTATAVGLSAGDYTVTVTDNNGCLIPATATVTITEPVSALSASICAKTNVNCKYGNTGSATVAASGGSGSYSYLWNTSPVQIGATALNLSAGTYTVIVTDNNGCLNPIAVTTTITEPQDALSANISAKTDVLCKGAATGAATVTAAGGSLSYSYMWSNGQTAATATTLSAGAYQVTVSDNNGCLTPVIVAVTISEPTLPLGVSISPLTQINVSCKGGSNGQLSASAVGGSGSYTYSWNTSPVQTTATVSGLSAGNYTLTVLDANGCDVPAYTIATVTQPDSLVLSSTSLHSVCSNASGSINLSVMAGTAPYAYLWSTGSTEQDISGLAGGDYLVTVTDHQGCVAKDTIAVQQTYLNITLSSPTYFGGFNLSGYNTADGSIDLTIDGVSAPYSINWSNGQTTEDIYGLSSGLYTVKVTDAEGCWDYAEIQLTEPLNFEMPTGISPNDDGKNDYFVIHGIEVSTANKLTVFNRWGNIVYETTNYKNDWNGVGQHGEQLPEGTYFVIFQITDKSITLKGYVDIRRKH